MDSTGADLAAVATVGDILGKEYRIGVAWTERLELLQETEEFRGDLAELQLGVDVGHRGQHLLGDLSGDELVYPADELLQVALFESQAGRIDVPAEVLKKVSAALDGLVEIETSHTAGGSSDESVRLCQYNCRFVERLDKT